MAYDEGLAHRIRATLEGTRDVTENQMFGGLAFLRDGKMFVGIIGDELMVRVGPQRHEAALREPHVRPMDFTGKPMKGYVYVAPEGTSEDDELARWIEAGAEFVATLPAKKTKKKTKKKAAKKKAAKKAR